MKNIVNLDLTEIDGNAFSLMGNFKRQAKKDGWTNDEIKIVIDECMTGDYVHLVATLSKYCTVLYESKK